MQAKSCIGKKNLVHLLAVEGNTVEEVVPIWLLRACGK